jgi:hypothetical protein
LCRKHGKPHRVIDAVGVSEEEAAEEVLRFVDAYRIAVLNVAGPRASGWGRGEGFARGVLAAVLKAQVLG